ncbi:MAG TPA: hypothetical protein VFV92_09990 [Candidatus Bathyarchaeia archaeon]|nr:hypothetical protein [Candidatus Bathyarchaeia archaeon]
MPSVVDGNVSSDEILDSLTRQASSQVGLSEANTKMLEILADEDPGVLETTPLSGVGELSKRPGGRFGHYAIAVMSIAGMVAVWFYSSGRTLINSNLLNDIIQRTNVRSVFGNPLEIGVVSMISLAVASWIAFRRRKFARILNASVN